MEPRILILLSVCVCVCIRESCQSPHRSLIDSLTPDNMRSLKRKFCGSELSGMLALLCHGRYNNNDRSGTGKAKKSYNLFFPYEYDLEGDDYSESQYEYPFLARESANSIIPLRFRKRGVADECCNKPCSLMELQTYCQDDKSKHGY